MFSDSAQKVQELGVDLRPIMTSVLAPSPLHTTPHTEVILQTNPETFKPYPTTTFALGDSSDRTALRMFSVIMV